MEAISGGRCSKFDSIGTATELIRDAGTQIVDGYPIGCIGRVGHRAHEARSGETRVAIFDARKDAICDGVIDANTGRPASGADALIDERRRADESIRHQRIAPRPS
jgi:hypothetical protein